MFLNCGLGIDPILPTFTNLLVDVVKIIIPILLIAFGMIDLAKAVIGNDEKVMKEAQNKFIKRIIYAVIIFFIVAIVQLVFGLLADASSNSKTGTLEKGRINDCIACFISDTTKCYESE